jgi:thiol reductant ABC exporter CydD subunit
MTVAAGVSATSLAVVQAWLLAQVVSRVFLDHQTLGDVRELLIAMLGVAMLRATVVGAADVLGQRAATHLKTRLRTDLTERLTALGPEFVNTGRSGELVNTAGQGVEDLDEYIATYQPLRYLAMIVPVVVALIILVLDPLTVLVLVVTGPMLVLFLALIGSRAKDMTERRFQELSWMSASFLDMLQGLATLKMFGRSREQVDNIREVSRRYGDTTMAVLRTAFETSLVLELSTSIATALVAVEVSLRLMDGAIPFDRALAVLIIAPEFFLPLRQLAARYHAGASGRTAAECIFSIIDTPVPSRQPQPGASVAPLMASAGIRLEHVSYAYDGGRRLALNDVSIDIAAGATVAIVGETGAGKTTVASLLLCFIQPDSGSITADGVPLSSLEPGAWRTRIAWVPQRPHLFHGTVADNLRLARPGATSGELIAAARDSHADEFIERLPLGYDTVIGERGAHLSGGERQRLAIARAFLKRAPFLILDEVSSHLDAESELMLQDALARLQQGRTVLIIAHRLNLAGTVDQVVVMHDGRVAEAGRPRTLLANAGGAYSRLVAADGTGMP